MSVNAKLLTMCAAQSTASSKDSIEKNKHTEYNTSLDREIHWKPAEHARSMQMRNDIYNNSNSSYSLCAESINSSQCVRPGTWEFLSVPDVVLTAEDYMLHHSTADLILGMAYFVFISFSDLFIVPAQCVFLLSLFFFIQYL